MKRNTTRIDGNLRGSTVAGTPASTKSKRNHAFKDRTGERFGDLVITSLAEVGQYANGKHYSKWLCQCDCGNEVIRPINSLVGGATISCGCNRRRYIPVTITDPIIARTRARLRGIWNGMNDRCTNPDLAYYDCYGGRGITVCEEWKNDFNAFYEWAMANGHDFALSLDRINNNAGYAPLNCRWTTMKEQNRNRRSTVLNPALAAQILNLLKAGIPPLKIAAQIGYPDRPHLVYNIKNNGAWQ